MNREKKEELRRGGPLEHMTVSYSEMKRMKAAGENFGIVRVKFNSNEEYAEYLNDVECGRPFGNKNLPPLAKRDS